jgi:UDP-glucose 4-epimerase
MKRQAVVTGARGFIGRHVARRLAQGGWQVLGIGHGDWDRAQHAQWGVDRWLAADVTPDTLAALGSEPQLIVHCAGGASVGLSLSQPHVDFQRTVATTAALLEFARTRARGALVVLPSSAAVYGNAQHLPIGEDAPLRPVSPYGEHKRLAEGLCRLYATEYAVRVAVVRLFSVYGPGLKKQLLWDACNRLARGEPAVFFGDGSESRDWLHVDDAAALLDIAGSHAGPDCPVVNGGSGEAVPVRELLTQLFRLLGRRDAPGFSGQAHRGDPKHFHADARAAQRWGWRAATGWRDGLQQYVDWFRRERA